MTNPYAASVAIAAQSSVVVVAHCLVALTDHSSFAIVVDLLKLLQVVIL